MLRPNLPAHAKEWACGIFWQLARANVLAERHQPFIDFDSVFFRQLGFQLDQGLFRRRRGDVSPAVGHTVYT